MLERVIRSTTFWETLGLAVLFGAIATWAYNLIPINLTRWNEPPGQGFYLLSKLFGLLTIIALWWQILGAVLHHPTSSSIRLRGHKHTAFLLLTAVVLHYALFVTAVYFRNQHFPLKLMYPVFDNYFKISVSLGWFAFVALLVVFFAAIFRSRLRNAWKYLHRLSYVVAVLGVSHGFMIGTETGYGPFSYLYLTMMASIFIAIVTRMKRGSKDYILAR